jgi:hypothetical protein
MLCEGIIGYSGLFGNFIKNLNDPGATNTGLALWRWNLFETIHTIAWCIIINGCIQGLLSLRDRWRDKRKMIITYSILAVSVVALTYPVWLGVGNIFKSFYPFGIWSSGNPLDYPRIGQDGFGKILASFFLAPLASEIEPLFPYLAVSFIGSIIGIVLSKPKEEIKKTFPKQMLRIGGSMYGVGVAGIAVTLVLIMLRNAPTPADIDPMVAIGFYMGIIAHRSWTPQNIPFAESLGIDASTIPHFAWLAQFVAVTGMSIMLLMVLFRMVEFRGVSHKFARKTIIIRRFGTVAFSNYNNQWLYFIAWGIISLIFNGVWIEPQGWAGTALTIILAFAIFIFILWLWEKISYLGSLEWIIRSITNNALKIRRDKINANAHLRAPDPSELKSSSKARKIWLRIQGKAVDNKLKWWQKGQIDVKNQFYNAKWIDIVDEKETTTEIKDTTKLTDSKVSLVMGIIGLSTFFLFPCCIFGLIYGLKSRKSEGKNRQNTAAIILSIITMVIFTALTIVLFIIKAEILGL